MDSTFALPPDEMLRRVMRRWVTGVAIATSRFEGSSHGMTINSFVSVSVDPPLVSVTMAHNTRTYSLVQQSGVFAVTILSAAQRPLAELFAGRVLPEQEDRMVGLETFTLETGAPLVAGGAAFIDCRVVQQVALPHSTLLIGEVLAARTAEDAPQPLAYYNRSFVETTEAAADARRVGEGKG